MNKQDPSHSLTMKINEALNSSSLQFPDRKIAYIKEIRIGSITAFGVYSPCGERLGLAGCLKAAQKKAEMANSYWQLVN